MPAPKWHLPICALYLYSSEHRPGNAAHATNANQRPRRVRRRREPTPDGRQRQAPHVGDERPATRLPAALDMSFMVLNVQSASLDFKGCALLDVQRKVCVCVCRLNLICSRDNCTHRKSFQLVKL
ncbi:hypothetical protein BDA96_10G290200 [Sorghum bicolor]|uniref:Uncharacterized protein n=1 Tax=Sorghum bicolor TaxID=4558 RepID=A0A921U2J7_SORBI|nr:hypothetical protein BDA96_10G290200 [Sorghum bicolor]